MKAILIDPFEKTVSAVEYSGRYTNIYDHIDCSTFDCVAISDVDDVFIDDEGLLKEQNAIFWIEGYHAPLAGKGLVLAHDKDGESVAARLTVEEVRSMVRWVGMCDIEHGRGIEMYPHDLSF